MLEHRRLAHMLRQRAAEIKALQDERERLVTRQRTALRREEELGDAVRKLDERASSLAAERERLETALKAERERLGGELKQAQYEVRRAERRLSETETTAAEWRKESWRELEALAAELEKAKAEHGRLRRDLEKVEQERDAIGADLKKTSYEARRVERRLAKVETDATREHEEAQHRLDALGTELRDVVVARDEALKSADEAVRERDEATRAVEEATRAAEASSRDHEQAVRDLTERAVEQTELALRLGKAQQEVETLVGEERSREMALVAVDAALIEVAEHLRRARASRSWRWGHALARAFRVLTFRRGSRRSSLDAALGRLQDEGLVKVEQA
jgi:chromosome segregation ATPase